MSSATALKFREDAKQLALKRLQDRKRSLLVLILRHLADSGYIQACKKLESEANLTLDQVQRPVCIMHKQQHIQNSIQWLS